MIITSFPFSTALLQNEIHHNIKAELITKRRAVNTMGVKLWKADTLGTLAAYENGSYNGQWRCKEYMAAYGKLPR